MACDNKVCSVNKTKKQCSYIPDLNNTLASRHGIFCPLG
jgi:hypothetical protein